MYQLIFYVPSSHLSKVKDALFAKGAGKYNHYENCCWQICGQGQFKPLKGSVPHTGTINQLEVIEEYKVEMICADESIVAVIAELKRVHPYEEVAYGVIPLTQF